VASVSATRPVQRGLAFLAGLGFAAVPSVGPFIALAVIALGRIALHRADRWWWLAAALLGLPYLLSGHALASLATVAQVLAAWLIFRSATEIRHSVTSSDVTNDVGTGLVVGLLVTLILGLRQFDGFAWETARTLLDAVTWQAHPAIFGHTMLVLAALLAIVVPSARLRALALALGAIGVVLSGAREAMFAWLIVAVGLRFVGRRGDTGAKAAEWVLIGAMVMLALGVLHPLGIGRTGFLTAFVPGTQEANLFRGTEVVKGDWWYPLGVSVVGTNVQIGDSERAGLTVTKRWEEPWTRLQQVITLEPSQTYTLSAAWRPHGDARPGFEAWGQAGGDIATTLSTYVDGGTHVAHGAGGITVLTSSAIDLGDGWTRAQVTFSYQGEAPVVWYVGAAPDRSNLTGVSTTFAELQLTATDAPVPYVPGLAERGVASLRASRLPIWRDALTAISARPLLGWGPSGLPLAMSELRPEEARLRPVAAHAHNMALATWVDRGIVGLIGLGILATVLALRAIQQRDRAAAVVLVGIAVLNTFDATLLSGTVIYPLAAILGWRAVGHRPIAAAETGVGSAAAVRVSLALGDFAAGAAAIWLGLLATAGEGGAAGLSDIIVPGLAYAALAWPAAAALARLYPGYGLPSHDELGASVTAAGAAALMLAFLTVVLPGTFALSPTAVIVAGLSSLVLAPAFRFVTKLILRALHLWGRPVVVLGTGEAAARVTKHLTGHRGIGLHPIAVFGSGDDWDVLQLPVTGTLDHAWRYIYDNNVRHAVVTPDAARELAFDEVLRHADRQLRFVQYLPDLAGLPSSSVVASPLGSSLALEVRNQLASGSNRAIKRSLDLVVSVILLVIMAVPLALVALAVRLDSRGSPIHLSPRVGRNGRTFLCMKFRTMFVDADERLTALLAADEQVRREYERYRKLTDDPRVTRVGKVLRRLSIDEFPQLVNVVIGQMSLVGPRPYLVSEFDDMGRDRDLIFLARPGMTGFWQVEARNEVSFDDRQAMEANYVRNWSVWWDLEILLRTPLATLGPDGK